MRPQQRSGVFVAVGSIYLAYESFGVGLNEIRAQLFRVVLALWVHGQKIEIDPGIESQKK
jgi:hypothetical protein